MWVRESARRVSARQPAARGPALSAPRPRTPRSAGSSDRAGVGALLALQRTAGNRALAAHLHVQRQAAESADEPGMCRLPDTSWIDDLPPYLTTQIDTFSQSFFDDQPPARQARLLERREANRLVFLRNLRPHLGDDVAIEAHFRNIVKIDLPGNSELWVHASTRQRLLAVKADLEAQGTPMPLATNGQALRGRHLHPTGAGFMMHPLGFAVDWRAHAAPHIKDPRLHALFEIITGGPPAFHLQVGGRRLGWTERHELIEQMGKGTADPARARDLLASVEREYQRLKTASAEFKLSLPEASLEELRAVERARNAVSDAERRLRQARNRRRRVPEEYTAAQEALMGATEAFETKKADVHVRARQVFAVWLEAIDQRRAELDRAAADLGVDLETDVSTVGELKWLQQQVDEAAEKAAGHRRQAATALRQLQQTERAVATTRSRIEAAQAWLAAPSGRPPAPEDARRWEGDLQELASQAHGLLDDIEARRAELAALLPARTVQPVSVQALPPARPSDRAIAAWRKQLSDAPQRLARIDERVGGFREPLTQLTAERADRLEELAARSERNKAVLERLRAQEHAKIEAEWTGTPTPRQRAAGERSARSRAQAAFSRLQADRQRYAWLGRAAEALVNDVEFVFRSLAVADPGVTQLLGLARGTPGGFFTPDPEAGESPEAAREAGQRRWSARHGFNLVFFQAMVRHGFELGVAWERSPDTMHFELVEGRRLAESGGTRKLSGDICE